MDIIESLIPTFEVGERVRVVNRLIEWSCPKCGRALFEEWANDSYLATVLCSNGYQWGCRYCGDVNNSEGWIRTRLDGIDAATWVPYTLLERIEE